MYVFVLVLFYSHCVSEIQSPQVLACCGYLNLSAGCLHWTTWTDNYDTVNACQRLLRAELLSAFLLFIFTICIKCNTNSVYWKQLSVPLLRGHVTLEKKSLLKEINESCRDNMARTFGLCALNDNCLLSSVYIHVQCDLITYTI